MTFGDRRGWLSVSAQAFAGHCRRGETLSTKDGQPALIAHADADGQTLLTKIWPPPRGLTSDRIVPYYQRFRRALETLSRLDIPVPVYRAHGVVSGGGPRFVIYRPLEGVPLRGRHQTLDLDRLGGFVNELHDKGIYFRGLHLGNIVQCPDGRLGLIDVQDLRCFGRPLGRSWRERNLGILCAHPGDLAYMLDGHWPELVLAYCRAAGWSVSATARMRERVRGQIERRRARRDALRRRRGLPPIPAGAYRGDTEVLPVTDKMRG